MDATVFRFVVRELDGKIRGARLEKVFAPLPLCWTFDLGRPGFLVVHNGKPSPFLFLASSKPENPRQPDARAMWLRKRLRGRRILGTIADWPERRVALSLSPGEGSWLVLSLSAPPRLADDLPPGFGSEPVMPALEEILAHQDIWKTHPHVTPPLRRYLRSVPAAEGRAFLRNFQDGAASVFYVGMDEGRMRIRLWPLENGQCFSHALDAAEYVCTRALEDLARARSGEDAAASREKRRLRRALSRLEEDRKRLESMAAGRETALLLRTHLHALPKDARLPEIHLPLPDGGERIALDPTLTVLENMERLFRRAAKGERGLIQVAARRETLLGAPLKPDTPVSRPAVPLSPEGGIPARFRNIKATAYRSSNGFLMFRGRSAKANHELLTKAASPFDYWLHALDVPGAHVVIKRDSSGQEVPERTIEQAAALAILASQLKMAGRGDALLCLVRDVRTLKGAALGLVDTRKVLRTVRVAVDPGLEKTLALER